MGPTSRFMTHKVLCRALRSTKLLPLEEATRIDLKLALVFDLLDEG